MKIFKGYGTIVPDHWEGGIADVRRPVKPCGNTR